VGVRSKTGSLDKVRSWVPHAKAELDPLSSLGTARRVIGTARNQRKTLTRISTNPPSFVRWEIWRVSQTLFGFEKCTPVRCTPVRCTFMWCSACEVHAREIHAHEVHAREVHAREVHAREMHTHEVQHP
jgi:hypothetical protein